MQEDKDNNKPIKQPNKASQIIRYILIAVISGIVSFYAGCIYKSKNMQISYISQGEILALEKERLSTQNIKDRQLFFGKPEKAIEHIEQIQKDMSESGVNILLTDSKIYGSNVTSVSKEVHLLIIERLEGGR